VREASGYQVWTAASGEETLAVAQARYPDVIVLDLLPGFGERETARALKGTQETAGLPVVVPSVRSAEQMAGKGAASRVRKPIEEDRNRPRLGGTKLLTKGRMPPALCEAKLEELLAWMAREAGQR